MTDSTAPLELPIGVTEAKVLQQLARIEKKLRDTSDSATKKFVASNSSITKSFTVMSSRSTTQIQNVSYQLQDMVVQITSGQGAARSLGQQMPQLLGSFGAMGAVLGTVAAVAIPLAASFLSMGGNGEELKKKIDELTKAVDDYQSAARAANLPTEDLAKKYGTATAAARTFLAALKDINKVDAQKKANKEFSDFYSKFRQNVLPAGLDSGSIANASMLLDQLQKKLKELRSLTPAQAQGKGGVEAVNEQIGAILASIHDLERANTVIKQVSYSMGISADHARALVVAISEIRDAKGPEQQTKAMQDFATAAKAAFGPVSEMPEWMRALYDSAVKVGEETAKIAGGADGTKDALAGATSQASALVSELAKAAQALGQLEASVRRLDISNAGDRARIAALKAGKSKAQADAEAKLTEERLSNPAFGSTDKIVRDQAQANLDRMRAALLEKAKNSDQITTLTKSAAGSKKVAATAAKNETKFSNFKDADLARMERQIELLGKTKQQAAQLEAKWRLLDEAKKRGIDLDSKVAGSQETVRQQIDRQAEAIGNLAVQYDQAKARADFYAQAQADLESGFADAIVSGKSLGGVLEDLAHQLAKAAMQAALFNSGPLSFGDGKGLLGSLFSSIVGGISGKRALGGDVKAGQTYLVGERGKELFTPSVNGHITANHALGGVPVTMPISIDARGAQVGVSAEISRAIKDAEPRLTAKAVQAVKAAGQRGY